MTGPGPGKIQIDCKKLIIIKEDRKIELTPVLYIHVKGYSLARVTHIDIEYPQLETIIGLKHREIAPALLTKIGNIIIIKSRKLKTRIEIHSTTLNNLIPPAYSDGCVIGGKTDGIFIGIKKELIKILEEYTTKLGWPPRTTKHNKT